MDHLAEKGGLPDRRRSSHDVFAKEVYGVTADGTADEESGETVVLNKADSIGLRLRSWINKFGAEENGIESSCTLALFLLHSIFLMHPMR